jgi:hypothetical protein
MAKIENQSGLTLGTNLFLHIQEVEGTDIAVNATTNIITQTAGDFEATSSSGGIEGSGFAIGDQFVCESETNSFIAVIDTISPLQIDYTVTSGTEVTEGAGGTVNIQRLAKYVEYREAGGLSFVDGVEATALHSKMQTLWKDSDLDKYDPLSGSIEPRGKAMYFLNNWDFFNTDTQRSHRGGAVQVQDTKASAIKKIYGHITAPETHAPTDQWNFWQREDAPLNAPVAAVTTGYMDELVLILDVANSIDLRGKWLVRCAEPGKTIPMQEIELLYAETVGVTVTNAIDPTLGDASGPFTSDGTIGAGGIYANIDVTKNEDVSVANSNVGVAGNVAMSKVGANITVTGMTGGTASEKATGTITLVGLPSDGDTITIDDGVNTATIFEFDDNSSVTGNNVAVTIGSDTKTTLTALFNAINDVQTLNIIAGQGVHANLVEGTSYNFAYDVEYDNQDYVAVHEKLNYLLRQPTDINQDATGPDLRGDKQFPISEFVGNTQILDGFPLNFLSNNSNDMDLLDQSNTIREFDVIASYTIVVPQAFIDATPSPQISIYVAATHGGSAAAIVDDASSVAQKDIVLTAVETAISFAYSTFSGGGHTPGTDLDIAIALNQPGVGEAEVFFGNTIQANTTQRFQLAPSVDPSYVA